VECSSNCYRPLKLVDGYTSESVTHGQCDARPTVTFPATEHQSRLVGTKLYCLVIEARGCEQLAQGHYMTVERPGVEPSIQAGLEYFWNLHL